MALAQRTRILLLDEPTTYLDIAHQVEILDLCADLHRHGHTLVAVLHDLNQACRYATHVIAMHDGRIVDQGRPSDIVTATLIRDVFGFPCRDPRPGNRHPAHYPDRATPLTVLVSPRSSRDDSDTARRG